MTMPTMFKTFVDNIYLDTKLILEKDGHLEATLFIFKGNEKGELVAGEIVDVSPLLDTPQHKDVLAETINAVQAKDETLGTIFVSETWMVHIPKSSKEGKKLSQGRLDEVLPPSEHPDRIEAVLYLLQTRAGSYMAKANIVRKDGGLTLESLEYLPDTIGAHEEGGRFAQTGYHQLNS